MEGLKILKLITYDVHAKEPELFAKLIMWWCYRNTDVIKKDRVHHCADRIIYELDGVIYDEIYEADLKYERTPFNKWVKCYHIINQCDTVEAFNLTQEDMLVVYERAESFLGTKYGVSSIFGLVWNDLTNGKSWGRNKAKRLICSESSMRLYIEHLKNVDYPIDYVDPLERAKYFPMVKVN